MEEINQSAQLPSVPAKRPPIRGFILVSLSLVTLTYLMLSFIFIIFLTPSNVSKYESLMAMVLSLQYFFGFGLGPILIIAVSFFGILVFRYRILGTLPFLLMVLAFTFSIVHSRSRFDPDGFYVTAQILGPILVPAFTFAWVAKAVKGDKIWNSGEFFRICLKPGIVFLVIVVTLSLITAVIERSVGLRGETKRQEVFKSSLYHKLNYYPNGVVKVNEKFSYGGIEEEFSCGESGKKLFISQYEYSTQEVPDRLAYDIEEIILNGLPAFIQKYKTTGAVLGLEWVSGKTLINITSIQCDISREELIKMAESMRP